VNSPLYTATLPIIDANLPEPATKEELNAYLLSDFTCGGGDPSEDPQVRFMRDVLDEMEDE
jgi:hypothetical protein